MSVKYNMQPSDWPVCRDLVMTSSYISFYYTSLSINCNMPPADWSSIQEGKGGRQAITERSEKEKRKINKKINKK